MGAPVQDDTSVNFGSEIPGRAWQLPARRGTRPDTLPELLAHLPLAAQRRSVGLGFATAEAVAKLGAGAEEELLAAAECLPGSCGAGTATPRPSG
jgi:hypothetical protein